VAQAFLRDRLASGGQAVALAEGVWLKDLLAEAITKELSMNRSSPLMAVVRAVCKVQAFAQPEWR